MIPASLPGSDGAKWDAMTPQQRARAAERLEAIEGWRAGDLPLDEAVAASGLSRSRFYRVAAEWRAAPSLAALGAFAGAGASRSRLDGEAVNRLQSVVGRVVALNAGASVSSLVRLMVEAAGVEEARLPGAVSLRAIVDAELRRIAMSGEAGHAVRFDCSAINLPQADGRPWIMFACVDAGTGAILGAAVAATAEAATGYPLAARDALARVAGPLAGLPWALRLARIEMTAGVDVAAAADLRERLVGSGVAGVQVASAEKRFGRYFRQVVGDRVGRIAITPARTEAGEAMPDNGDMTAWSGAEAGAALAAAVDAHDAEVLARLAGGADARPPEDLVRTLELIASG